MLFFALQGVCTLLLVFVAATGSASAAPLSTGQAQNQTSTTRALVNPLAVHLRQLIQAGKLAPTVQVLPSLAPTLRL